MSVGLLACNPLLNFRAGIIFRFKQMWRRQQFLREHFWGGFNCNQAVVRFEIKTFQEALFLNQANLVVKDLDGQALGQAAKPKFGSGSQAGDLEAMQFQTLSKWASWRVYKWTILKSRTEFFLLIVC